MQNIAFHNSPPYQHASNGVAENLVRMAKSSCRRLLLAASLDESMWHHALLFAGNQLRCACMDLPWTAPCFGELVGAWRLHEKTQIKSLEDRGCVGRLLAYNAWTDQVSVVLLPDGSEVHGLAPRRVDPRAIRYSKPKSEEGSEDYCGFSEDEIKLLKQIWTVVEDPSGKMMWLRLSDARTFYEAPFVVEYVQPGESLVSSRAIELASKVSLPSWSRTVGEDPADLIMDPVWMKLMVLTRQVIYCFLSCSR